MSSLSKFLSHGIAGAGSLLGLAAFAGASSLTQGNLIVVRIGDGLTAPTSASTAVFLDEYTPAGVLVQTIALPTAANGSNFPLTNSGTATSEGYINLSVDGHYLTQAGYAAAPGLASIASTASPTAPRVVAITDLNGIIDTSTALNGDTSYSGNNIRSAVTVDGTAIWTAGTATAAADGGIRYIAGLGTHTSTQLSSVVTNTRVIGIYGGQLYTSSASGSFKGINMVGTGLPTTNGQTITLLPGFPSTTPSQYDYFFADANTLYVAEDGSLGSTGGIEKWTFGLGIWTRQYTLSPGAGIGCRGLTGTITGGVATLFATTTLVTSNDIVTVTDAGSGSTFTTVTTAATNEVFRGLRILASPTTTSPGSPFCFGDGSGTGCPCSNVSPVGDNSGCLNSLGSGGKIVASGTPSLAADTIVLTGSQMSNSSALYFQGTTQMVGGSGVVFGDGLRCAGGSITRLGTKLNSAGGSQYPSGADLSVSVKGLVSVPGVRTYQIWYRNPAPFCNPETFNLSNGWSITWTP